MNFFSAELAPQILDTPSKCLRFCLIPCLSGVLLFLQGINFLELDLYGGWDPPETGLGLVSVLGLFSNGGLGCFSKHKE